MRLLSALRCARCRCRSSKAQQLGFLLVHVAILAVSGSGYFVGIAWVASLAFVLACLSLALQLVRGSLTGRFSLLWVLVASNVVVYTAAACLGARLHGVVGAPVLAGVPLVSWYGYWTQRLVRAPPAPGEALRPPKELRRVWWGNKIVVVMVLVVEFVQFNALAFNPELGAWKEIGALASSFSYSFLIFDGAPSSWSYGYSFMEIQIALWFAVRAPGPPLAPRRRPTRRPPTHPFPSQLSVLWFLFSRVVLHIARPKNQKDDVNFTMASPVWIVLTSIFGKAIRDTTRYRQLVRTGAAPLHHLADAARSYHYKCTVLFLLGGVVGPLAAAFGVAVFLTTLLLCAWLAIFVTLGLALCTGFSVLTFLHFPILMNMLSTLHCIYPGSGAVGYMQRMPTQQCWAGRHWVFVSMAFVSMGLLYPAMVYFERKRQSAAEVSYHVRFTSSFHAGKVALSAASFFSGFADVYLIVAAAILLFFLHRNNVSGQDNQPVCCNVRSVRLMRSMLLCCALWSCGVTLSTRVLPKETPEALMATLLLALWALTLSFFAGLIHWPHHEPIFSAAPPSVRLDFSPVATAARRVAATHTAAASAARRRVPSPAVLYTPLATPAPTAAAVDATAAAAAPPVVTTSPRRAGADKTPASPLLDRTNHNNGSTPVAPLSHHGRRQQKLVSPRAVELASGGSDGDDGDGDERVVLLAGGAARPKVMLLTFDDGFERADGDARDHGQRAIVLCTSAPRADGLGGAGDLSFGDEVASIDGEDVDGPRALERLSAATDGQQRLIVRKAPLRGSGCRRGPGAAELAAMADCRRISNVMMLFPQDATLQGAACATLRARLSRGGDEKEEVIGACKRGALLTALMNAVEVHHAKPEVQAAAATLLRQIAAVGGSLRANLVAAGLLPALKAALRTHARSAAVVSAAVELAAEVGGARNSPPGVRRALCEAIAVSGVLAAVLKALRAHRAVEGVAQACCELLIALKEEFAEGDESGGGSGDGARMPPELRAALGERGVLAALREVKGRFTSNVLVALGVDWALEMGAAAATAAVNENDDSFLSPALPPAVSPRASPRSHRRV